MLPHFDVEYSARLVLGQHWRTATEAQRKRFIDAFYQSLMRNYGDAIVEFTADRLTILPFKGDPAANTATVRTQVKRSNGTPVPVNYSLRATPARMESLGRHDRGHLVREELPDGLRLGDCAERYRCGDPASRGAERIGASQTRPLQLPKPAAAAAPAKQTALSAASVHGSRSSGQAPDRLEAEGAICFNGASQALRSGSGIDRSRRQHDHRPGEGHRSG